jgi:hypothetical protein
VFVYSWEIAAPCRACDVVAVVHDALEFDAAGRYQGAKLLGVDSKGSVKPKSPLQTVAPSHPPPPPPAPPPPPQTQVCFAGVCVTR